MARVNHKKVKQLLNEERSRISDRQFFTSRILALHFEDIAMAQTKRYKYSRRIHVKLLWDPNENCPARTNNLSVKINTGHWLVTHNRTREDRYYIVGGLFTHELGHCLYTDFLAAQTYVNYLMRYRWYPKKPRLKLADDIDREKLLWDYVKADEKNLEALCILAQDIENILEDGYIENRMLTSFPGKLGAYLEMLREQSWEEMPTVTQLIERESTGGHIMESIMQMILSYAKYGEIKYGEEPLTDQRIQIVFSLLPALDSSVTNTSGKERWNIVNLILIRCWEYVQDYIEIRKKQHAEAEAAGTAGTLSQMISEELQALVGSSSIGEGASQPVPDSVTSCPAANAQKRAETKTVAKKSKEGTASEDGGDALSTEPDKTEGNSSDASLQQPGDEAKTGLEGICSREGKQEVTAEETGRIPYQQTERVSEPSDGTVERNNAYERERYAGAASDVERLLDKMAERAACTQLENERLRELNDAAQGISYGDVHAGVPVCINRIAEVDEELVEQYNTISGPLLTISRQLQKSLIQQLKDKQRGGKQTGLMMGRRLDAHALCRNDGKVFYKNALPNEIPEMAVGLLLDESGSMCSCDRCTYARASAIILYDFCQSLRIPVMVYGHSTSYHKVELYSYAEFESIDQDDRYRMIDISARGSNRDGAALRYVAERLSRRPEEIKLLILVSDGQPAAPGYGGSAAEEDLRGIKQEYRRKGIVFIAAAIGDDKPNIERIYGNAFLDITDLSQLPVKLTAVVKRHIQMRYLGKSLIKTH